MFTHHSRKIHLHKERHIEESQRTGLKQNRPHTFNYIDLAFLSGEFKLLLLLKLYYLHVQLKS
ncbi:hypothetical protein VCRA2123E76_100103 [Vibrio crassostreae]|nr:hypothetical protein VCRA2123E76_100103 [Vibrio crassostreae]